jgi:hypothetical protein
MEVSYLLRQCCFCLPDCDSPNRGSGWAAEESGSEPVNHNATQQSPTGIIATTHLAHNFRIHLHRNKSQKQNINMVSFSPIVSIREYQRTLDLHVTDTFLGLTIGWNYNESSSQQQAVQQRTKASSKHLEALDWSGRLEILRDYGFPEHALDVFWTNSRNKAVQLHQQKERLRKSPVARIFSDALLKQNGNNTANEKKIFFLRRRRQVDNNVDITLHQTTKKVHQALRQRLLFGPS